MRERSRRLLKIAVLLFVVGTELISVFWIPAGWVALASGLIGSVLLIVPPLRIEWAKGARSHLRRLPATHSRDLEEHRRTTDTSLSHEIEEEHPWDSFSLILGGLFLLF